MLLCRLTKHFHSLLLLMILGPFVLVMQGCGGGGNSDGTFNADPTGYYAKTGTASVDDGIGGTMEVNDLQAMVNGNRFIAISDANGLVYDGMITEVNGNDFTAEVNVFQDGSLITTATLTGMITEGEKITGTLSGNGLGIGTIDELLYATSNNEDSVLSRVENNVDERWFDRVGGGEGMDFGFAIDMMGSVSHALSASDGVFAQCSIGSGAISPIIDTSLYTLDLTLSGCNNDAVNGDYSGLASIRTENIEAPIGDRLVLVASNSDFSFQGEFKKDNLF